MNHWTLICLGIEKTAADRGIGQISRRLQSQAADTLSFSAPGRAFDADPIFEPDAVVEVWRDRVPGPDGTFSGGTRWFVGRVTKVPVSGTPRDESHRYELSNAWADLERLVFQQTWYTEVDPDNLSRSLVGGHQSRVTLFQGINGSRLSLGAQIAEVVAWAAGTPGLLPLQIGAHDLPITPIFDERTDVMCAEVLRSCLRWTPDAVTWWDYTTTPPTVHFARRAQLAPVEHTIGTRPLESFSVTPRHDLLMSGVALKYEKTNTVDGVSYRSLEKDIWPVDTTERSLAVLTSTINLQGSSVQHASATIKCRPYRPRELSWWVGKLAKLARPEVEVNTFDVASLVVHGGPDDPAYLPFELVEGQIAPWMETPDGFLAAATIEASIRIGYTLYDRPVTGPGAQAGAVEIFHTDAETMSVRLTACPFKSGTYTTVESATYAEPTPVGLARELFAAVGVLQYEGTLTTLGREVGASPLGRVLNVAGGRVEWAAMRALVQTVDEDVDSGRMTIGFGPAGHLGAGDLVELLLANRQRRITVDLSSRRTGRVRANDAGALGLVAANDSAAPQGDGGMQRLVVGQSYGGEGGAEPYRIALDPSGGDFLAGNGLGEPVTRWLRTTITGPGGVHDAVVLARVISGPPPRVF